MKNEGQLVQSVHEISQKFVKVLAFYSLSNISSVLVTKLINKLTRNEFPEDFFAKRVKD